MKKPIFYLLLLSLFCSISCTQETANGKVAKAEMTASKKSNTDASPLEGTWKLLGRKWFSDTKQFADCEIIKIYTKKRFAFVFYRPEKKEFGFAGGGTYTIDGNTFTETIEYFSGDPKAVGTQQTFNFEFKGDLLYQTGRLNTPKYTDRELHEFYQRVDQEIDNTSITGVWELNSAIYGDNKRNAQNIKERYGRVLKIITPTHWYGAYFNAATAELNGVGFGSYTLLGNQYTETIKAFSWDNSAVGTTPSFTMEIENGQLHQSGKIHTDRYQDYVIDEKFVRIE